MYVSKWVILNVVIIKNLFNNYLKQKHEEIGVKDLILSLRTENDNKLSERKANSYGITHKANIIEQMTKTQNKNQKKKLAMKGKKLPKKLMTKYFICNKAKH